MASDQVHREKTTVDKEVVIEKDRVPKMTTHFESLTERTKDSDITGGKETPHESGKDRSVAAQGKARESHELGSHEFESLSDQMKDKEKDEQRGSYADKARSTNMADEKEAEARKRRDGHEDKTRGKGGAYSVGKFEVSGEEGRMGSEVEEKMEGRSEDKGRSRGMQGTEEMHEEKQRGGAMQGKQERGCQKQEQHSLEEISQLRGRAQQSSMEAFNAAEERYNPAKEEVRSKLGSATEYAAEKGSQAKDTMVQGAQKTSQYVAEKGSQAKDTLYSVGQTAKEYTVPKAEQAKEYAVEKASEAKGAAVDTTKVVGKKAAAAKDTTVQSGKGTAEYAGKVAADVKDKAMVAGWSTAHYTTEKAAEGTAVVAKAAQYTTGKVVEGTKAAATAVEGVAEYAGHKAAEILSKPLDAAKEAAVSTGETMKEYTARKKEEAQRELEVKRGERQGTERGYTGGEEKGGRQSLTTKGQEKVEDVARPIASTIQETFQGGLEQGGGKQEKQTAEYREDKSQGGGGVLQAIGETVVEIAQQTKDLVIGEGETEEKILGYRSNQVEEAKQRGVEAGGGQ